MCRGDRREEIFREATDYRAFLETLGEACERTGFVVHSYVLMPNHYHLLLETPEANLVAGMTWFQGTYTQRFNRRHGLVGHLFQGRYKAIPVESQGGEYFRRLSDYIHLNPARGCLLDAESPQLEQYEWSSFRCYAGLAESPAWLCRTRVLSAHGVAREDAAGQRCYARILALRAAELREGCSPEELEAERKAIRQGWCLGGDAFRDHLMDLANEAVAGSKRDSYRNDGLRRHDESEATKLLETAMRKLDVDLAELRRRKQSDLDKQAVAWWVKSHSVVSDDWLREKLQMGSRANTYRAVARFQKEVSGETRAIREKLKLCSD
jgi:REP element-mobilizing transposase RayT